MVRTVCTESDLLSLSYTSNPEELPLLAYLSSVHDCPLHKFEHHACLLDPPFRLHLCCINPAAKLLSSALATHLSSARNVLCRSF